MDQNYHTITNTPLLHTSKWGEIFGNGKGITLPTDEQGLFRPLETVLLPNTPVCLSSFVSEHLVEVSTDAYPYSGSFFTDIRFLQQGKIEQTTPILPSLDLCIQKLSSLLGNRYCWGGNSFGIPELLLWYPPKTSLSPSLEKEWILSGFDCSGLIYYITNGFTPRNTSSWLSFGQPIDKDLSQLRPLDAIVWKGHILFVLDEESVIESRAGRGVIQTNLIERMEVIEKEVPHFVIRRWHPDNSS